MPFVRLLIGCYSLFWGGAALAASPLYHQYTLANGLEVVVIENHTVPAVSHMLWYKVGAADDPYGTSGIAHFLEHLMFKGTETHPGKQFSYTVAKLGGEENAFTSYDYTAYFQNIATEHLPQMMAMESDRMRGLILSERDILDERNVILEERSQRIDTNPDALLGEQIRASLYLNHPYGRPNIGWRQEMETLSRADALTFYQRYYHPGNAVLVVAGDTTPEKVLPLAEFYYGKIQAGPVVERHRPPEPPQTAARRLTMHHPAATRPLWMRFYHAPSHVTEAALPVKKQRAYALMLLAHLLGGSDASLLHQTLVLDQKKALSVAVSYDPLRMGPGWFAVTAIPTPGVTPEALETAIDGVLAGIPTHRFTREELKRTQTLFLAESIYARDSLQGLGMVVGELRTAGLPLSYLDAWEARIRDVTTDDMQKAAASVLIPEVSVTGLMLPEGSAK